MIIHNKIDILPWHPTKTWNKRKFNNIDKIIVHQELGEGSIEAVNNYHITPSESNHLSTTGAPHFAYHLGIDREGNIIQANSLLDITWHTKGQNLSGIGIMVVGNFNGVGYDKGTQEPTPEQIKSLELILRHLNLLFTNIPRQNVFGHDDFGKPACPGYILSDFVKNYRS